MATAGNSRSQLMIRRADPSVRRRRLSGQSLIEYVILLVFLTGFSGLIFRSFNRILAEGFQTMGAEVEKSLITGSFDFKGQNVHQSSWIR